HLQIEEDLQSMFGLAQKAIGVIERAILLIGEAAGRFERLHRQEGVALADLGQVAAVEELKELNRELNVADAAVSGLDLAAGLSCLRRALFDLALERLDAVDL